MKNDICPYSKNGICTATKILKVECDGGVTWHYSQCAQYQDMMSELQIIAKRRKR